MKLLIFDPAMCCSTGVCGPSVDPELTRMASAVYSLKSTGIDVVRFNLANEPAAFVEHEIVQVLLHEQGPDVLPITLLDGEVLKTHQYPTNDELAEWTGVNKGLLTQKPKVRLQLKVD